jgi:predicted nucleic acid-binding protein
MRSFFDTNILVYLFDEDSPGKKAQAQVLLKKETESGRALLSTQVLQEFYVAVTRKLEVPLPAEKAEEAVGQFRVLPLVEINSSHILKAIRKSIRLQFSFWDALIIEAAVSGGASILYTEDLQHGQTIDNLKILNPFRI